VAKPPKIVPHRVTRSAPSGYIFGRLDKGRGPGQWLKGSSLLAAGVATAAAVAAAAAANHGFGFSVQGRPAAGQILGPGLWTSNITFQTGGAASIIAQVAATSSAVFNIQTLISGVYTTIGTITFAAGGTVGALAWIASPETVPTGQPLQVVCPASQDATLANIVGVVDGSFS
jgi:hypothetical protein